MKTSKKGFSLVELLVVIAIIALLTGIITVNLTQSKAKSRDAKRVSDIAQIQLALELFFDRCNQYPAPPTNWNPTSGVTVSGCSADLSMFLGVFPTDPTSSQSYQYAVNTSPATDYVLRATLESNSSVLTDDVDGTVFSTACDDGSYYYCVQPR